ncbi:MAG TPA: molybdopterin molybdenumtransferase MoeA [Methanothermobacter sp.]|jgi:molybdopterin molybdotransferase|uniref:Molybdopterin molybdenumtransferase MoeA n=1 Tax=Methanothermobacter tenebrarum TaxID=680118 RepID=A0ABM7YCD4_9EURY|nr:gephyrin-like molybdotransferase Glp [Methanothermobacter tenebrarum]MDD3454203.1 molybdopterin-binding protein [Methanobacteriales archaeon]MDI6881956.1 molybdopterin-binding protein [Methanothermobacter sp.]MDX9693387.1 molybdopterin-binding protein [Methanothermobacter sp.]BDH79042.1 molybdopterin molybdenumtransferase MoeA [Methanothermobacter tenebrarum]HHW16939.1 molybdopterin molybdenumtransferase MoeA [Methanothermobacter sp.]
MGREFLDLVDISEAHRIIRNLFKEIYHPPPIEKVNLENAYGRVLAQNVKTPIDLPPFNRASRDGYALKAEDTFHASEDNPKTLKCIEVIEAGAIPQKRIKRGCCSRISTGAPIPEGADAIVMVEYAEEENDNIIIYKSAYPGQHIAQRGLDIPKNEIIAWKNSILSPEKIGAISAAGISKVPVIAKPKIGILSTGNELIEPSNDWTPGKIFDSNSHSIAAAVKKCGCEPKILGIVKDDYTKLHKAIQEGILECDILITSGGTSAGAGDMLREVIEDIGKVMIHGISIKPGKPTLIGEVKGKLVFGLPGFPVSALIIFDVLLRPYLMELSGKPPIEHRRVELPLARRLHSSKGRIHYALVKVKNGRAYPILKDSGAITSLADADGYIKIPKNVEILEEGSRVKVSPLSPI